jgi:large subunit ribosomal protein L24e
MPERRVCNFTHEEIEPGTGMMFVKRDGSVFYFKDRSLPNHLIPPFS